jgi:hypothetical protein
MKLSVSEVIVIVLVAFIVATQKTVAISQAVRVAAPENREEATAAISVKV